MNKTFMKLKKIYEQELLVLPSFCPEDYYWVISIDIYTKLVDDDSFDDINNSNIVRTLFNMRVHVDMFRKNTIEIHKLIYRGMLDD